MVWIDATRVITTVAQFHPGWYRASFDFPEHSVHIVLAMLNADNGIAKTVVRAAARPAAIRDLNPTRDAVNYRSRPRSALHWLLIKRARAAERISVATRMY